MKQGFKITSVLTGVKLRKKLTLQVLALGMLFGATAMQAQGERVKRDKDTVKAVDNYQPFTFGLHLKNMHLWHGFTVTPGPMAATNLEYNTRDKKFTFGFWGGTGAASDVTNKTGQQVGAHYKEFSIYTVYRFSNKFFMEAVTHNNYTGVEERGDVLHYWSYDKTQGYNFVDLNFGYQVSKNTLLYLATIVGGGSGDYEVQTDGSLRDSYTHYLEVKSKVWEKGDSHLSLFAGGAWSFVNDKTFYTEGKGNFINIGATLSKNVKLGSYVLPVDVTAMWNPEKQKTVLQVDFKVF
ncbi:hypothetical protein SAMN05443667_102108 [Flavobacterium gillisiae]|uniref:MetA-pathway of phenol degradation n=1 Tax=Flavobacterium gillisiae TaxID=150146 RepID=A0A1H3YS85_9FLAO|nr:hypothetical protein [Flavobacterium gillisiae]SEA14403.1 hypothetical protein SAMN05443667_102108 [Flavobacterium gillisiae]